MKSLPGIQLPFGLKKGDVGTEEKSPSYDSMIWDHGPTRPLVKLC